MERNQDLASTAPEVLHVDSTPQFDHGSTAPERAYDQVHPKIAGAPWSGDGEKQFDQSPEPKQPSRRGLTPKVFWALIFVIVLVIAAAIGAGIGGGLAGQKKSSNNNAPSSATSPTGAAASTVPPPVSTSESAVPVTANSTFASNCNLTDNQWYTPGNAKSEGAPYVVNNITLSYLVHCYTNIPDSSSGSNPQISKLGQLSRVASLQDCITACAAWNDAVASAWGEATGVARARVDVPFKSLCSGVVYYMKFSVSQCDMMSNMQEDATRVLFGRQEIDSAILRWDESK